MKIWAFLFIKNICRILQAIEQEDYSGVARKVREFYKAVMRHEPSEEYMKTGIIGLKEYYAIALLDPLNAHAVSEKIDYFWHAHILHAEQYELFCKRVVGRTMHHIPMDKKNPTELENVMTLYDYTSEIMRKIFKNVETHNWPLRDTPEYELVCTHGGDTCGSSESRKGQPYLPGHEFALFPRDPRGELYAYNN